MMTHQGDMSIDEAMADPLIRTVMRADNVEPRRLESMLRTLASVVPQRDTTILPAPVFGVSPGVRRMSCCGSLGA